MTEFAGTPRFQVLSRIGAGGMGVVYQALDRERQANVALKTLKTLDGDALLRLKNEFRALQDLQHPNLVSLGELIEEHGQWFFTMELVAGVDFMQWVCGSVGGGDITVEANVLPARGAAALVVGRYDEKRLRDSLVQLARGLVALHSAQKVHRDIKPSNILVTPEGRVVLLDFGLVVNADRREKREHLVVGTVDYMAPEQAAQQPVGPAADWYSVGVLAYQALTGRLPFSGFPLQVLLEKQRQEPPPPRALVPSVPADLDELCAGLLRFDPNARPTGASMLARLSKREPETPSLPSLSGASFVGRAKELGALTAALDAVGLGRPVTVLVRGESGVGKSALARHFVDHVADERSAVVLSGRCYERESVPYKAIDGVIDSLSQYLMELPAIEVEPLLPDRIALVAQVFPVLRRVEAVARAPRPEADPLDPKELRTRVFAALRELLARISREQPLVVVIDDLQWADTDSLSLLGEVLYPSDAPPLLLLATVRSEAPLKLVGDVREIFIGGLPPDEAQRLATLILARLLPGGDAVRAAAIARETAGHPLFIDELVRHALGGGEGPARLDDALGERIGRLDGEMRRLLDLLAVADAPLPQETAARAAEISLAELTRHASYLRVSHLARTGGARGADPIEAYHDRVRHAVLVRLDEETKRRCHQRLALALETEERPEPGPLVVHWRGAGDEQRAAGYAAAAAAQAAEALAFDRAARLYRTAIDLSPEGTNLRAIWVLYADALANAGRSAEAGEAYECAVFDAPPGDALELRRRAAEQFLRGGHIDEGLASLESVLGSAGMHLAPTPKRALASLLWQRARLRVRGLRFRERDISQVPPSELTRIDICWSVSTALGMVDAIRGADFQTRNLLLALQAGEPRRVARGLAVEAVYTSVSGTAGHARAQKLLVAADSLARRLDDPHTIGIVELSKGICCSFVGKWREDREHCARAERVFRERCTGVTWEVSTAQYFTSWSLGYLGEVEALSRHVGDCLRDAESRGDLYAATQLRTGMPNLVWLARDDIQGAREAIQGIMQRWSTRGFQTQHWGELFGLTNIDLYAGDAEAAHRRVTETWEALERSLLLRIQLTRVEAWYLRGRAALAQASHDRDFRGENLKSAADAAGHIERERVAYAQPLGRLIRAGIAHQHQQHARTLELLDTAASELDAADMKLHATVARLRRGQLLGGDEGRGLINTAETWMHGQKIHNPARMAALFAPGFP